MPCTTILAGKKATFDGSTMMARNEDSPAGEFTPKKFIAVLPEDQPGSYKSVISGVSIDLPDDPMRYTAVPNALPDEGIWGEAGINEAGVAMSETETITSNSRVLAADPLVKGGIGEEDLLTIVLPYIRSAREGVLRLGGLLERYGTYEMNGIGFQDLREVWWLESVGGHHWIAKRVPDDSYVVMPNQQGIDSFDLADAFGEKRDHLCSADLIGFIEEYHLDPEMMRDEEGVPLAEDTAFDARGAFGSREDADHTYNTPRAWDIERFLNPRTFRWYGSDADFEPESDDLPWSLVPERKITVDDVKYVLSLHFQGTEYDPYGRRTSAESLKYRPVGVNRTNFVSLTQFRPDVPAEISGIQWISMGSNVFNAFVPFYANVTATPAYFAGTDGTVTTSNFYWSNRLIAALADAHMPECQNLIERYQKKMHSEGYGMLLRADAEFGKKKAAGELTGAGEVSAFLEARNREISDFAEKETADCLGKVLYAASMKMRNGFSRSDA